MQNHPPHWRRDDTAQTISASLERLARMRRRPASSLAFQAAAMCGQKNLPKRRIPMEQLLPIFLLLVAFCVFNYIQTGRLD